MKTHTEEIKFNFITRLAILFGKPHILIFNFDEDYQKSINEKGEICFDKILIENEK